MIVLVAGVGSTTGYLAARGLSTLLIPTVGRRIMWLISALSGVLLMWLRGAMPESYRFLRLAQRSKEAEVVARRFDLVTLATCRPNRRR